jgi:hypothetical protein
MIVCTVKMKKVFDQLFFLTAKTAKRKASEVTLRTLPSRVLGIALFAVGKISVNLVYQ